eukprot:TRINITY_DN3434_c1_g1_i2.p1 TRINITY_DN3434_c1_g1~~TRINITY_DN3434_c1_g1_i2.p1  ORF type:complete len:490 (-),score=89.59 TRINITY_DN3434_c1_g1_i2:455-1924(-)
MAARRWRPVSDKASTPHAVADAAASQSAPFVGGYQAQPAARWRKKADDGALAAAAVTQKPEEETAESRQWCFAFGPDMDAKNFKKQFKIAPISSTPARLSGHKLVFDHRGGLANLSPQAEETSAVHGVLHCCLSSSRLLMTQLGAALPERSMQMVNVLDGQGQMVSAAAFPSAGDMRLTQSMPPPKPYLKQLQAAAADAGLDASYCEWLGSIEPCKGERPAHYWDVARERQRQTPQKREIDGVRGQEGRLRLRTLKQMAPTGATLVDIGANLGKCSRPDLAEQLLRAAAAGVSHIMLTGCSVKGSQDAKRLCEQWTGEAGLQLALEIVGVAARREIEEAGVEKLPELYFTAGVHPHDAKSCNEQTLATLTALAGHPRCVAIGECGLDYDRMFSARDVQLEWCRKQVELAAQLKKPLFLHERDRDASKGAALGSAEDLLRILDGSGVPAKHVCVHCFTGQKGTLDDYVRRGYFVGLTRACRSAVDTSKTT